MKPIPPVVCLMAAMTLAVMSSFAGAQDPEPPAPSAPELLPSRDKAPWPHVRLDREAGVVEVDAKVVLDEAEWLELVVCTSGSREYESVAATEARPSHIHLALMALGLEPGNPMSWHRDEAGELVQVEPAGPQVMVTVVWEVDGKRHEMPVNQWIKDNRTGEAMPGGTWLFTGSTFVEHEGQQIYMADLNGTVVSLVNFGDDLLGRATKVTNMTDEGQWVANAEAIPPVGTALKLRLKPVSPEAAPTEATPPEPKP